MDVKAVLDFIAERMAEDELARKAAEGIAGPEWTYGLAGADGYLTTPGGTIIADALYGGEEAFRDHVSRHDPGRTMRRDAAAREMITGMLHFESVLDGETGCGHTPEEISRGECEEPAPSGILQKALRAAARSWDDHPAYQGLFPAEPGPVT